MYMCKRNFYLSSSLLGFRCLIFEQPALLTLGGLVCPEEGVKVKMSEAFLFDLPHGQLHGLYVPWLHPLISSVKLSTIGGSGRKAFPVD